MPKREKNKVLLSISKLTPLYIICVQSHMQDEQPLSMLVQKCKRMLYAHHTATSGNYPDLPTTHGAH